MNIYFGNLTWIRPGESAKVWWSFLYFYCILAGYFILRPLRDEMGIVNGAENMQWLFTGTFIGMLLLIPVFGFLTQKFRIFTLLSWSVIFFILNLFVFYLLFLNHGEKRWLASLFFIWLSVYNLFIVSLFWSLMSDVYRSRQSKRLFGIIAAGGSIGALTGPVIASLIATYLDIRSLILVSAFLLIVALLALRKIVSSIAANKSELLTRNPPNHIIGAGIFNNVKKTFKSSYLSGIVLFIVLYTAISTFLYFKQAYIVEQVLTNSSERLLYFSRVDLFTNCLALFGQFVLANRFAVKLGLALTLGLIPFLIGVGFWMLSVNSSLYLIAAVFIAHRAGNYSLLKPAREMLFTVRTRDEKYQAKNFIDTVVYRGGDALTGWLFTMLISFGLSISGISVIALFISLLWAATGFYLGKKYVGQENKISNKPID